MKRFLKFCFSLCVALLTFSYVGTGLFSYAQENATEVSKPKGKYSNFYIDVKFENDYIEDGVNFIVSGNSEVATVTSTRGSIKVRVLSGESYTISLAENDKYDFTPITVVAKFDNGFWHLYNGQEEIDVEGLTVTKKVIKAEPIPEENTISTSMYKISELNIQDEAGNTILEPLTFIFYNEDRKVNAGEFKSENGKLPQVAMYEDETYTVALKENYKYEMEPYSIYTFMNGYPINLNDPNESYIEELILKKKELTTAEGTKTIPEIAIVNSVGKTAILDRLEFIVKNENTGAIEQEVVAENGKLPVLKLKREETYSITLKENPNYTMEKIIFNVMSDGYPFTDNFSDLNTFELTKKVPQIKEEKKNLNAITKLNGEILRDVLSFEVENSEGVKAIVTSKDGLFNPLVTAKQEKSFTIKLKENNYYEMETINVLYKANDKGELVAYINGDTSREFKELILTKKEKAKATLTVKGLKIVDSKDTKGEAIAKNFILELYNYNDDELVATINVVNGIANDFELNPREFYTVKLIDSTYRLVEDYIVTWNPPSTKAVKIKIFGFGTDDFDKVVVIDKAEVRTLVNIPVLYKGDRVTEPITFELISDKETITTTTENGILKASLLEEDVDYYIRAVGDKYETEFFPIVIKQKPTGKHPYNHLDCNLVQNIVITAKDDNEKPSHTIENSKYGIKVKSDFYFSDLRMDVDKVDIKIISILSEKEVDIYDITFKNIYRGGANGELVKLSPEKQYEVTIPKQNGKTAAKVYYVAEDSKLKEYSFKQTADAVIFTTNHFSMYAVEYATEISNKEKSDDSTVVKPDIKDSTKEDNKLETIDKSSKQKETPKWIVKNNGITITGINFAGYELRATKIATNIQALNSYNYEAYDLNFVDNKGEKVVLPTVEYTVTVPKISGQQVEAVYYISDNEKLEKVDIIKQSCDTLTFKTTHFSKYAVVYGLKNTNKSPKEKTTRPCDENTKVDGTKPCNQQPILDGVRPCEQSQSTTGTRSCNQQRNSDGLTLCKNNNGECNLPSGNCSNGNSLACSSDGKDCKLKSASGCTEKGCLTNAGEATNTGFAGIITLILAGLLFRRREN